MRKWIIIGVIIVAIALGFLIYTSFGNSVTYYVTVSELISEGADSYDTNIRVTGKVADSPIDWNPQDLELKFAVEEGNATLPVLYEGPRPNGFEPGVDILVEGEYQRDKVFKAANIMMQCPSKYTPEE